MNDVRLTATNPEDSSVVPVACNSRGELLVTDPVIGEIDNDLTINGSLKVGPIEATGGVSVTGSSEIENGIVKSTSLGDSILVFSTDSDHQFIVSDTSVRRNLVTASQTTGFKVNASKDSSGGSVVSFVSGIASSSSDIANATHFQAESNSAVNIGTNYGFRVFSNLNGPNVGAAYGFYSDLSDLYAGYNFYANGSAPNYFGGLTEHKDGIKLSGGNSASVVNGFYGRTGEAVGIFEVIGNLNRTGGAVYGHRMEILDDTISGTPTEFIGYDSILSSGLNLNFTGQIASGNTLTGTVPEYKGFSCAGAGLGNVARGIGFHSNVVLESEAERYNFYAEGTAPNYFAGNITCDGLINGAFSLRMQTDDPDAFETTWSTDEAGIEVEKQTYIGTTEDLLSIIKDLRARVDALEAQLNSRRNYNS